MKRAWRLTESGDFLRVRRSGKSWAHRLLVLLAAPNDLGITRCGFSVSKRLGKAVVRNRTKRLLRESVRKLMPRVSSGWDLVVIARNPIVGQDYWTISQVVEEVLIRAGLIRSDR